MKQKTLSLKEETKKKLDEFKEFVMPKGSHDDFMNYLMNTNPKMLELISNEREKVWKDEFIETNSINPTISWEDFVKSKLKEIS